MANKNIKINLDYSQFTGGMAECQRKMSLLNEHFKLMESELGKNATEVDKLTLSQKSLTEKLQVQDRVVELAREKLDALTNSESATAEQVDRAQIAYTKQLTKFSELKNQLVDVNEKLDETSEEEQNMSQNSNTTSNSIGSLASSIASTITGITAFVQALQQTAQAIIEVATKSTQWADDLSTLSSQTGIAIQTLQELSYASSFVDVSIETLQSSMSRLTQSMANAQEGSKSARTAFDNLNVSVTNADGSLKSTEQVFYEVIDALGQIDNQAERDAASMEIFGRSAQQLNPLIEQGSQSLRAYGEEAQQLGIIMSDNEVAALTEAQNSFDRLGEVMNASENRVSAAVAPAFANLADIITNLPSPIIDAGTAFGKVLQTMNSVVQTGSMYIQTMSQLAIAKSVTTAATTAETGAEISLGVAAAATNAMLLPQIVAAGLLAVAIYEIITMIQEAIEVYKLYNEQLDEATKNTYSFWDVVASGGDVLKDTPANGASSGNKHYALGGKVAGRKVWVGEQGAELVDLPLGSTVYNHQESSNMTSSSNVYYVTIDAKNVDDFTKVVNVFNGLSQSMNRGGKVNG